jgi:hypothetical protein
MTIRAMHHGAIGPSKTDGEFEKVKSRTQRTDIRDRVSGDSQKAEGAKINDENMKVKF